MLIAKNSKDLEKLIMQKVAKAMQDTVAPEVKQMESENVFEFVYSAYDPKEYERRMNNGGLSDISNMSDKVVTNGNSVELTVDNNTMSNEDFMPRYGSPHPIAGEVEFGYGYDYGGYGEAFEEERPFIRETINELKYGKAKELLKKGLKNQGIDSI
jgi:hypothetical protein